ncbi:MAG: hypothetical protein LPK45_11780, partial [Bacteroidota bacterium]|nr:hypothetical protein [Bacteroidota bacterium]MDX5431789.1 hypothetical protein [Bacteroidota bacterium]MDX5470502.1 hypothetical protein [Bacteroidota bacterium]
MKRLLPLVIVFFVSLQLVAQYRAMNWYFGRNAGISFSQQGTASAITDGAQDAYEACASISDRNGNLLFYTDGDTVWNARNEIMPNGKHIEGNRSATQGALIVPKPGSKTLYYIFTLDNTTSNAFVLNYSEVDMSLNNGLGDVTSTKGVQLLSGVSERMAATFNASGDGVWVVVRDADEATFYSYEITKNGISSSPVSTSIGSSTNVGFGQSGQMKFSPNGEYLAWVARYDRFLEVLRFNKANGEFENWTRKVIFSEVNQLPYGVEFSADGRRLYVSRGFQGGIYQFDMNMAVSESLFQSSGVKITGAN